MHSAMSLSEYGSTEGSGTNRSRSNVLESFEADSADQEQTSLMQQEISPKCCGCFGVRHLIAFLGFLGFANVYAMRVNLSVAIVSMVNSSAIPHVNTSSADVCPVSNSSIPAHIPDGEFAWPESVQGTILGSFFYGYILTNLLGGRLAEVWGGQRVMGTGVLLTALLTVLTPVVARWNTAAFIALRVLEGMAEGVTFPAMSSMLARWVPPLERSQTVAIVYAGGTFGTVVALPVSGYLCDSTFLGGWPAVFYVFGAAGVLWSGMWLMLASDYPSNHSFISRQEKTFIATALDTHSTNYKTVAVPWRQIFTSLPFYAILVAHTTQNWGFYTLLTEMPTYMDNILHFDIKKNAYVSALPYLVMWLMSLVTGFTADAIRSRGLLSTTAVRKICNSIGSYVPCVCLFALGCSGCDSVLSVALLVVAVGVNGASFSGFNSSHLDVAPNLAGTLMGITNTVATIPGFLAPLVVGLLVNGDETLGQWRIVFWISAAVLFAGNTFYICCYVGEVQPWNEPRDTEVAALLAPASSPDTSRSDSADHPTVHGGSEL